MDNLVYPSPQDLVRISTTDKNVCPTDLARYLDSYRKTIRISIASAVESLEVPEQLARAILAARRKF